jgi:hypothetical protein
MIMFQNTIAIALATAAFAGMMSTAQAATDNPLHPSYFADKAKVTKAVAGSGKAYVDSRNPLHPMYGRTGEWQMAAKVTVVQYVDSGNPLHPSFRRF